MESKKSFVSVAPSALEGSAFSRIGEQWMLITAESDDGRVNTMTASWGTVGILWNKPVAICFIRPQRYTYEIVERAERLSLSFLPEEYRGALRYCGTKSGRDGDKFAASGLTVAHSDGAGVPYVAESEAVMICRKLYVDDLCEAKFIDPEMLKHYAAQDYHRFYVCEIEDVLVRA